MSGAGFTPEALGAKDAAALAHDWLDAKAAEEKVKEWRLAVEAALATALGCKTEGAKTHKVGYYKVTLTGVLNRKLDAEKWAAIKGGVLPEFWPIKTKEELDVKGVEWLQVNRPDLWKVVAQAVTTTPGKVGVKVVRQEEG